MKKYCQYYVQALVLFCIPCYVMGLNQFLFYDNEDKYNLTTCVIKLIKDMNYKQYVSIMNPHNLLELSILHQLRGMLYVNRSFHWQRNGLHTDTYIIAAKTYEELENGLNLARNDFYWNPRAKFLIIVEHLNNDLNNITHLLLGNNFVRVIVLSKSENDYDIYTYSSNYSPCNRSEILVPVSQCSNMRKKNIFPVVMYTNIRGCHFKIVTTNIWPYFDLRTSNGLEHRILKLFEKVMGIKLSLIERSINGTKKVTPGVPDGVKNNEFEGAAGAYALTLKDVNIYDFSYPLWVDHLRIIIHRADFLDTWHALCGKNLLALSVLFVVFLVFCFFTIRLSLFPRQKKDGVRDIMVMLGYFLNKTTVKNVSPGWSQKIIFCSLLFLTLIFPYIIQGYLYTLTTNPVRGYEEMDAKKIYDRFELLIHEDWPEESDIEFIQHCTIKDCLLRIKNTKEHLYTLMSFTQILTYDWLFLNEQCNSMVYTLTDPFTAVYHTFYFRRGSLLRIPFDKFNYRLSESGLMQKKVMDQNFSNIFKCKSKSRERYIPRSLWDLKVAFVVLLLGYFVSTIVFICEYWLNKC